MSQAPLHHAHWPPGLPHSLDVPATSLVYNLEVNARRYPGKPAIHFYGRTISYGELWGEVQRLSAWLRTHAGVADGDRVLLGGQSSPQFVIGYYAILHADAVVVPVNPMLMREELRHYVEDSGARAAIVAQDLLAQWLPLAGDAGAGLAQILAISYGDYLPEAVGDEVPDWVRAPAIGADAAVPAGAVLTRWRDALAAGGEPRASRAGPDELAMIAYTSGTTGAPKGCMHSHRTIMASAVGSQLWRGNTQASIFLVTAPMFHLLGMQNGINAPIYLGASIVILPRWHAPTAAALIERHRVTAWSAPPAMLIDFFASLEREPRDIASLVRLNGGGAAMPESVATLLKERFGIDYIEGYGLTETASFLHCTPLHRPKRQCLGIPAFDVDSRIVDPVTLEPLPQGETGELITAGPQVMLGYWRRPKANEEAFVERDGKRFLRTGDLAYVDEDGYFFMRDRLKRMINASGYKVWPAEVEALMHAHPGIQEACVVSAPDSHRGETVKAIVVRRHDHAGLTEAEVVAWCREHMAAYKAPRIVEFVDALPRSGTGKVMWRELQQEAWQTG